MLICFSYVGGRFLCLCDTALAATRQTSLARVSLFISFMPDDDERSRYAGVESISSICSSAAELLFIVTGGRLQRWQYFHIFIHFRVAFILLLMRFRARYFSHASFFIGVHVADIRYYFPSERTGITLIRSIYFIICACFDTSIRCNTRLYSAL